MAAAQAVYVRNACKSYGKKEVLKNLCMNVPKSCIYGLLGSSGCGKTTLLSCIVGRRSLNSGDIWVLGGQPGTEGSGVPGPKVGYMPQEIALVGEFTVKDAIFYFGRIFEMEEDKLLERFYELSSLLDLPPADRFIKDCSGGQQRRISFAASMVQMPDLLILDEPTVGVDPILRERIWYYLVDITTSTNMAVVVTTHYIEECRQANMIGLMRNGCLLTEESPTTLLRMFQTDVLEEVFFILSQKQHEGKLNEALASNTGSSSTPGLPRSNTDISLVSYGTTHGSTDVLTPRKGRKKAKRVSPYKLNMNRMKAVLDKNWKQFYRNVSGMIFICLFLVVENLSFLWAIGHDPQNQLVAVVNHDSMIHFCENNFSFTNTAIPYDRTIIDAGCYFKNMSCRYLTYVDDPMITKVPYDSLEQAMEDIRHGIVVGVMYMAENFTESFEERIEEGRSAEDDILMGGEIKVWLDMADRQIGETMKYKLWDQYKDFQKDLMKECNFDDKVGEFLDFTYVYGDIEDSYNEFMTPGLEMTMMFFLMTVMTSQIIINDRCEGLWDRSVIAGVSPIEICLTHFVIQLGIVVLYTAQTILLTFVIFGTKVEGSMWTAALLIFLQGLDGVGYGFWVSVLSYNVNMANVVTTGSFYIMILISGCVWPIEGMPYVLRWISKSLPFTLATQSFRNVMKKGWAFANFQVWLGVAVESIWIVIFAVVNAVLVNSKK